MGPVLVLLAGGHSTRLWPIEDKSLIKFMGRPLLEHQLERFRELGLEEVVVIANPGNLGQIERTLLGISSLRCSILVQAEPKGMGDALLQLRQVWDRISGRPIYVNQVHDLFDQELHMQMLQRLGDDSADSFLAAVEVSSYFPGGYLEVSGDLRIRRIVEKPGEGNEPSSLVTVVAHLHKRSDALLEEIERQYRLQIKTDDHYERAMSELMRKQTFRAVPYCGRWVAIKYPWHVLDAMDYFLSRIGESKISEDVVRGSGVSIRGPVIIERGVRLFAGAAVIGPAYLGEECIVGNNALVRGSMIGARSVVGFATEIARSYVGEDCWFHTNYIGDSVICDNVSFGSGSVAANLRLDESNVWSVVKGKRVDTGRVKFGTCAGRGARLGINASIMPGVKIGKGAVVGPGVVLRTDLPDNFEVFVEQNLKTRPRKELKEPASRQRFRQQLPSS